MGKKMLKRWLPKKLRQKPFLCYLAIILPILFLLECCLFNWNFFTSRFDKGEQRELPLAQAYTSGFQEGQPLVSEPGVDASIEFFEVGFPVHTLTVELAMPQDLAKTTVYVDITDETSKNYRYNVAQIEIINGNKRSQTMDCQFSGKVGALRLRFPVGDTQSITVEKVVINKPVAFQFSLLRLLVLLLAALLIYACFFAPGLRKSCAQDQNACKNLCFYVTLVCIVFTFLVSTPYLLQYTGTPLEELRSETGNQITKELVDAFAAGQVALLEEPDPILLETDNPYDWGERNASGAKVLWDHCLYNGKYYSYYGIGPVLFLFLPYHLLTGFYFPNSWAVMLFAVLGILMLSKLFMQIVKRWFPSLPLRFLLLGLVTLQASCGIWFSLARPLFYELAISSGFFCLVTGVYLLVTSDLFHPERTRYFKLFAASFFLGLAVLCRPTLAAYCAALLPAFLYGFWKIRQEKKQWLRYLLCAFAPLGGWAALQLLYNYLRFDSFFDFGIQYSLTINDFTRSQFHPQFVIVGLFAFLFAAPALEPRFPFLFSEFQSLNLNGYYFVDDRHTNAIALGLFFRALPAFAYLFAPRAYRLSGKNKSAAAILGAFCLGAPLVILYSVWESGYAVRYTADFSWQMLMGAFFVAFTVYHALHSAAMKKLAERLFACAALASVLVCLAQVYSFINPNWASAEMESFLYSFGRLFEFWR